jgi:aspartyl protease
LPHITLQMTIGGPILTGFIGPSQAKRTALAAAGQPIPPFMPIRGLIDTGASCTCVDPSVLSTLGLSPTGSVTVNTPSTGSSPHTADQYDVSLMIPSGTPTPPLFVQNLAVMCAELLAAQGFHALIGRDILSRCLFAYNGTANLFTLAY